MAFLICSYVGYKVKAQFSNIFIIVLLTNDTEHFAY